ncbi:hypothetical protein JCM21900_005813, partial [Sporobolomyces salmonicolor]
GLAGRREGGTAQGVGYAENGPSSRTTRYARAPPEAPLTTLLPPPFRASLRRYRLALPRLDIPSALFSITGNRGKVHGSLARAGKVKSQTPKVEAQEKKKKVTGRAKKRLIYNSRFVNVTTQPFWNARADSPSLPPPLPPTLEQPGGKV